MIKVSNTVQRFAAGLAALLAMAGFVVALAGAQAAVPDHWGFAYVDKPSVPGIPDPTRQAAGPRHSRCM